MLTCVKAFMKICLCFILGLDFDLEYTFFWSLFLHAGPLFIEHK